MDHWAYRLPRSSTRPQKCRLLCFSRVKSSSLFPSATMKQTLTCIRSSVWILLPVRTSIRRAPGPKRVLLSWIFWVTSQRTGEAKRGSHQPRWEIFLLLYALMLLPVRLWQSPAIRAFTTKDANDPGICHEALLATFEALSATLCTQIYEIYCSARNPP